MALPSATRNLLSEPRRSASEPSPNDDIFEFGHLDPLEEDEDRGIAVEVRNREQCRRSRGEQHLLLAKILDPRTEYGATRRALTERGQVTPSEWAFPHEELLSHSPLEIPPRHSLVGLGKTESKTTNIVPVGHVPTLSSRYDGLLVDRACRLDAIRRAHLVT
jgi:hypothetical protein